MPELPEVETTRRGIAPHVVGHTIAQVTVREPRLRWPVAPELPRLLAGARVEALDRRAKYLLFRFEYGTLIIHLGMSGSLRLVPAGSAAGKHDHLDICFEKNGCLRLTDPRRFGAALWCEGDPNRHALLRKLGPEPFDPAFDGAYLFGKSRGRKVPIKAFVMDAHVVVGVGNIYANEALFLAGIHPERAAGAISRERYERLAEAIRTVLAAAIEAGGTTLRDFVGGDGRPGYFAQQLRVYGRADEPCPSCGTKLRATRTGQRSTVYCPRCQR